MILWGALVTKNESEPPARTRHAWPVVAGCAGIVLALYVFMADAIAIADQGVEALRSLLPQRFNTPLFLLAWGLMAVPVIGEILSVRRERGQFPS